jgi:hypothetical protein
MLYALRRADFPIELAAFRRAHFPRDLANPLA